MKMNSTPKTMSTKIEEIISAKEEAGSEAYLWLQADAGDCILWTDEASSENDDGTNAVGRWTLTPAEVQELEDADTESDDGIIDDRN